MKRTSIHALCLVAMAVLLAGNSVRAGILYDSTGSPRYYSPLDLAPLSFNVNSFPDAAGDILWDNAPIYVGGMPDPATSFVQVTRLSFDLLRVANAPACNFQIFWTNMVADAGANRGTNTFPFDGPMDDPGTAVFVQTISLPANGPTGVRQIHSIGDGVTPLFTTAVLNQSTPDYDPNTDTHPVGTHPGYGYFFVGMRISSTLNDNLWVIASNPNNLFYRTDDFQDEALSTIDEYHFDDDILGDPVYGTMSMRIEGNLVPEPASLATLGLAALGLFARRRRVA